MALLPVLKLFPTPVLRDAKRTSLLSPLQSNRAPSATSASSLLPFIVRAHLGPASEEPVLSRPPRQNKEKDGGLGGPEEIKHVFAVSQVFPTGSGHVVAGGEMGTPVPRAGCMAFWERPILAEIRGCS